MPLVVPGLLQIAAYIEALMRSGRGRPRSAAGPEPRKRRQEVLERADGPAPSSSAVITEASLLYRWGSGRTAGSKLLHLAEMGERPGVAPAPAAVRRRSARGLFSAVQIFDYDGGEASLVFTSMITESRR